MSYFFSLFYSVDIYDSTTMVCANDFDVRLRFCWVVGFIVQFISYPVISGFTSSAAVLIACSQLKVTSTSQTPVIISGRYTCTCALLDELCLHAIMFIIVLIANVFYDIYMYLILGHRLFCVIAEMARPEKCAQILHTSAQVNV